MCQFSEQTCLFGTIVPRSTRTYVPILKGCTRYNRKVSSESYIKCRFSLKWITHNYSQLRIPKLNQLQWIIELFEENSLKYCSDFRIVFEIWFLVNVFFFLLPVKWKVHVNFGSTIRDFAKCCTKHVKESCILGDQRPLSCMHHSERDLTSKSGSYYVTLSVYNNVQFCMIYCQ